MDMSMGEHFLMGKSMGPFSCGKVYGGHFLVGKSMGVPVSKVYP